MFYIILKFYYNILDMNQIINDKSNNAIKTKNIEKIDKIKNKNIRNSLYQLLNAAKNDKN